MLSLSLLSIKDNYKLIECMDNLNPDYLHLDVADGKFVPSYAEFIDMPSVNSKVDVHLMVADIEEYIEKYESLNPEYITFHIEATNEVEKIIDVIRNKNIKVGIALNPGTNIDKIVPYLNNVDLVLVMSVEPGYGGQSFIESSIDKIEELYKLREENNYTFLIQIDGGINDVTHKQCDKGDIFVVGSYITLSDDYKQRAEIFK